MIKPPKPDPMAEYNAPPPGINNPAMPPNIDPKLITLPL